MDQILIIILITVTLFTCYSTIFNPQVLSIDNDEVYLVVEDNMIIGEKAVILEGKHIYLSFDGIKKHIDSNIFYDEKEEIIVFSFENEVIRQKLDNSYYILNSEEEIAAKAIKNINNNIYIPIETIENIYNMDYRFVKETNAVILTSSDTETLDGKIILNNGHLRTDASRQSSVYAKNLEMGNCFKVYEKIDKWYKIRTESGMVGFIEEKYVKIKYLKGKNNVKETKDSKKNWGNQRINLVWDHLTSRTAIGSNPKAIEGLNIICPTWFSIVDNNGTIKDIGDKEYVNKYKDVGYSIWGLVNNSFEPELTHEILSKSSIREKIILDLVNKCEYYNLDRINLDFENINIEDKDLYVQFIRELYPVFNEKGLIVSVDVTPISISENWSKSFDRSAIAEIVDYVVLMAYDQHWSTSPKAGSVAQCTWVEKKLVEVLDYVPNDKLILGVPFYTRLWKEEKNNGKEEISSEALSMEEKDEFIKNNNIVLKWDGVSGQYYGEMKEGENITYKIWVEDKKSIELKVSLVNKYNLAGVASWRKGFEKEEVWEVIKEKLMLN